MRQRSTNPATQQKTEMDLEQMGPQTFLYGCELKAGKDVSFNPEDDDFDHQLSVRMACVDPSTKDELNVVEIEGQNSEGQQVKAVLATLKPSTLPSVCLGGFEITPPVVFRLRSGTGPVHISGQHLIIMGGDQSFDEDDDDEEEEEELTTGKKRPAPSILKSSKKIKLQDADDDDDDEDDDDEDDEDEEESGEESPVKAKKPASKPQTPAQNGKGPKPSTPAAKSGKSPEKKKIAKSPQTPPSPAEIKAKMMACVEKGVVLPKIQGKFENYVKNCFKTTDTQVIEELWKWRQSVK